MFLAAALRTFDCHLFHNRLVEKFPSTTDVPPVYVRFAELTQKQHQVLRGALMNIKANIYIISDPPTKWQTGGTVVLRQAVSRVHNVYINKLLFGKLNEMSSNVLFHFPCFWDYLSDSITLLTVPYYRLTKNHFVQQGGEHRHQNTPPL